MKTVKVNHPKGERPHTKLTVRRVEASVFYSCGFAKEHYLSAKINKVCKCLLFEWNGVPVAFCGLINAPRGNCRWAMAISRIVVLPDYQGLGLSTIIFNFVGGIVKSLSDDEHDYHLYIKTAHSKFGKSLDRNPNVRATLKDKKCTDDYAATHDKRYKNRITRRSYCKEYVGQPIYGFEELLKPIADLREKRSLIR
jgi:hypothetical protein